MKTEHVDETIERFFQHGWIHLILLDRLVAVKARRISREFNLKPLDAIHVASAISSGAKQLLTYDSRILRIGTVGQMQIHEPSGQRVLDLDTSD